MRVTIKIKQRVDILYLVAIVLLFVACTHDAGASRSDETATQPTRIAGRG